MEHLSYQTGRPLRTITSFKTLIFSILRQASKARTFCIMLCALQFFASSTQAMGLLDLQGKILGFDQKEYKILVGTDTYEIRSAELSPEALADLKKKHSGDQVHLMVPTTAVISVKPGPEQAQSLKAAPPVKN